MEDQTRAFLSILHQMSAEEVRTSFLELFTQALSIENAENVQITSKDERTEARFISPSGSSILAS
jgi:hypothetical protein